MSKKSEVGGQKSEVGNRKSEIGKPEEENSSLLGEQVGAFDNSQSEIEHSTSEAKERPTANSKLQTENMEVHHHPEVEEKGIKEYLLEGLMIFVAVTMGFFAESIRENITNNEHAKQLSVQLVQDLKSDTSQLREIDSAESFILRETDTLINLLQQPIATADMKKIQRLTIRCYSYWPFYPSVGGITAIKNELRLKQFSNSKTGSLIMGYEGRTSILKKIEDIKSEFQKNYIVPFLRLHFTPNDLNAAFNHDVHAGVTGQMRDLSQKDMTQMSADLVLIRSFNIELLQYNRKLKGQAIELIKYVTKQYDLTNE